MQAAHLQGALNPHLLTTWFGRGEATEELELLIKHRRASSRAMYVQVERSTGLEG